MIIILGIITLILFYTCEDDGVIIFTVSTPTPSAVLIPTPSPTIIPSPTPAATPTPEPTPDTTPPDATASPVSSSYINESTAITITFSETMDIDSLALGGDLCTFANDPDWQNSDTKLVITPQTAWNTGNNQSLTIYASDIAGNTMENTLALLYNITACPVYPNLDHFEIQLPGLVVFEEKDFTINILARDSLNNLVSDFNELIDLSVTNSDTSLNSSSSVNCVNGEVSVVTSFSAITPPLIISKIQASYCGGVATGESQDIEILVQYVIGAGQHTRTTYANPDNFVLFNGSNDGDLCSVPGFGGFLIMSLDTPITNNSSADDFKLHGNAFSGWNEPGIVEIMQDTNANGLPDDTWYLFPGNHLTSPYTLQSKTFTSGDYPTSYPEQTPNGRDYPSSITLSSYRLPDEICGTGDGSPIDYVDVSTTGGEIFDIDDAVDPDNVSAPTLTQIDFVKITNGCYDVIRGMFGDVDPDADYIEDL